MRKSILLMAAVAYVFLPSNVGGTQPGSPGAPRFGVVMNIREAPRLGEAFQVLVRAGAITQPDAVGDVRLRVPAGIEIVRGEVNRAVHVSNNWKGVQDNVWSVYLRPVLPGKYSIRAWMRVQRPKDSRNYDEMESRIDLDVRADSSMFEEWSHGVRYERLANDELFRYGGEHMVRIDAPEEWMGTESGKVELPVLIDGPPAVCRGCKLEGSKRVGLVVTVGTDGTVRWVEGLSTAMTPQDPIMASALEGIRAWRFKPGRLGTRPMANWYVADIEVVPEPK